MTNSLALRFLAPAFLALLLVPGAPVYGQEVVNNGCTDANGVRYNDCSRLNKGGDRVTIKATDCGNADSTSVNCPGPTNITSPAVEDAAQCRTIYNTGTLDYFVPWKTPEEWGRFLAWVGTNGAAQGLTTHPCCEPQIGSVCANQTYNSVPIGPNGLQVTDPNTGIPIQLGKRLLGKRGGNLSNYAAQNDVSNTLDAAVLLNNSMINYKVTYVCNNGGWVKTYEEGSCTPLDGACGPSVPATGVSPILMTALQQQNLLCIDGSVMQNLTDHGTYWSWDCLGTPTRATATCTAANASNNNGTAQCGTANFARLTGMPTTAAQLCTQGVPTAIGGTGTQWSPWSWTCNDTGGAYDNCIAYLNNTPIDGMCGSSSGNSTTDGNWDPGIGANLCANGTQLLGAVAKTSGGWNWTCAGENGGQDIPCSALLQTYIGDCNWPAVDGSSGTTPPNPMTDPMCTLGTPSALTYGPDYQNDGRMSWQWQCLGTATPACDGSYQCICEKFDLNGPQPGFCGDENGATNYTSASVPPTELCGVNSTVVSGPTWNAGLTPPQWQWSCQGLNGGGTVACGTANAPTDGECRYDMSFTVTPFISLPTDACYFNQTAYDFLAVGAAYTYKCPGVLGGATANCAVSYEPMAVQGICGYPKGDILNTGVAPPDSALCSSGTPTNQQFNPMRDKRYEWTCQGSSSAYDDPGCRVYVSRQQGMCGGANNTQQNTEPTAPWLCTYGTASAVTNLNPGWSWTCQGMSGTPPTACNATYGGGPPPGTNGVCGSAGGSETSVTPTSNLCSVGTATAVLGNGPWTWSCQGLNGGLTTACIATLPAPTGPGQCGTADGTTIPSKPNTNLCLTGNPTVVAGDGPWSWDCVGTSAVSCTASICAVCAGDLAGVAKSAAITSQSITYGGGVCAVGGTANWSQIDTLSSNNAVQTLTLGNTASGLNYSGTALPSAAPSNYCPPCYRRAKTITGSFTVQRNGVCAGSTLNDGNPATINFDNILIVP